MKRKYIEVSLKIDTFTDREILTSLLARNGYEVKEIKLEEENNNRQCKYYVVFKY